MPELSRSTSGDEEILTGRDADELTRLLSTLLRSDPSGHEIQRFVRAARSQPEDRMALVDRARNVVAERKRRSEFLPKPIFGEPGWDILLALYIAEASGPTQSVSSVSNLIDKPLTTTIRWLDYLERERLIVRARHPLDSRVLLLELTDKARQLLDRYLATFPSSI